MAGLRVAAGRGGGSRGHGAWRVGSVAVKERGAPRVSEVLDGLRPDYVTPELMPMLWELRQRGAWSEAHHAVFPTVTRVNAPSLATGAGPGVYGLMENAIYVPEAARERVLNTGSGIPGVPSGFDPRDVPSYTNVISPDFRVPTTWKASAAYQRTLGPVSLGTSVHYSRTSNNFQYYDRNMLEEPYFTIEGGRPVWVPPSTIPVNSGRTNVNDSRTSERVGRVLELVGDTELEQRSLVLTGSWRLPRNALVDAAFTWNDSEDNSSFNCCIARTSVFTPQKGNPRDLSGSWGPSDNDFRYQATLSAVLPRVWGFQLSGLYIGQTGRPISGVISGGVNGDDIANNDLAFVFDPDDPATPPAIAQGMRRVLENPDNRFRD